MRTSLPKMPPRFFNISVFANALNKDNWGLRSIRGSCHLADNYFYRQAFFIGPHDRRTCDNVVASNDLSSLTIETEEWIIVIKGSNVHGRVAGPHHRLDLSFKQKKDDAHFVHPPHGLVGQSFDGDGLPRSGRLDVYPRWKVKGTFTTSAMAEGAIEGNASDYVMAAPYATAFRYSSFDAYDEARLAAWETRRARFNPSKQMLRSSGASERDEYLVRERQELTTEEVTSTTVTPVREHVLADHARNEHVRTMRSRQLSESCSCV